MPSRKDLYDLHFVGQNHDVTIRLGTPEAKGWGDTWAEALDLAQMIELVPRKHAKGMPGVTVILAGGKKWLYYLRTQGILMGKGGESKVKKELVTYNIGWTRGEHSEVTTIYPNGAILMQTGITIDRSQKDGSNS
jgi:hypothetical protein